MGGRRNKTEKRNRREGKKEEQERSQRTNRRVLKDRARTKYIFHRICKSAELDHDDEGFQQSLLTRTLANRQKLFDVEHDFVERVRSTNMCVDKKWSHSICSSVICVLAVVGAVGVCFVCGPMFIQFVFLPPHQHSQDSLC